MNVINLKQLVFINFTHKYHDDGLFNGYAIFLCSKFVWSLCPQFQAKICQFLVNCVIFCIFVTTLSPRNNNYVTLKNILKKYASLACIIESMPKMLILFCEIWVLNPSFFGTPLRSHYQIFSPQIKQENWFTYCSMKIQKYLCYKLGF